MMRMGRSDMSTSFWSECECVLRLEWDCGGGGEEEAREEDMPGLDLQFEASGDVR